MNDSTAAHIFQSFNRIQNHYLRIYAKYLKTTLINVMEVGGNIAPPSNYELKKP